MKFLFFCLLLSQFWKNVSNPEITYRQLSCDDFRGPLPQNEPSVAARSTCQLAISTETADGVYHFVVRAYFLPDCSFIRVRTARVLRHEQTHFKIAEIQALKLSRKLEPLQGGNASDSTQAIVNFENYFRTMDQMDELFDWETNHGLDKISETKWENKISQELLTLETASKNRHGRDR